MKEVRRYILWVIVPVIILIDIVIGNTALSMISAKSDIEVLVGLFIIPLSIIGNILLVRLIKKIYNKK